MESVQKEGGDVRIDVIILVVRRRLSRSSYKCIGVPSGSVGSHEVMNLTVWDIYPLDFRAILHRCLSMVGQALHFPLLSHSLSLTKSVVKLTAVSVCQSESESYKSTHLSRRKLWFHLSLSLLVAWSFCLKVGQPPSILFVLLSLFN